MGWSWRIGRIAGIDVYVHFTFLLLLAWVGIEHYLAHGDIGEAMGGLAFILALFGIVVLHELGHALTARRFGIRTRDIILLPIGGVARLERMPDDPRQELLVALAGPAVNVVLAAVIYVVLSFGQGLSPVGEAMRVGGGFLEQLFWVNVSLALFNLLPAFPMDGGRVLRALLSLRMERVRATEVAARIGQGLALLLAFLGLFSNPMLVFIGLFVWLGASEESSMVQVALGPGRDTGRASHDRRFPHAAAGRAAHQGHRVRPGRLPAGLPRGRGRPPGGRAHARRPDRRAGPSRCGGPRRGRHAAGFHHGRTPGDAADRPRAAG